jgi:LacI family repressor for deo operon, udp, cdd, tsx, nupC, and nupG
MATIREVAKVAGVSTATVSRVLSGYPHVRPAVREKVLNAVNALGFEPNQTSQMFRTTRTNKIIVTVPNIANVFFSTVIQGAEAAAVRAGYTVLLGDVSVDGINENDYGLMLKRKEADGMIFLGHSMPSSAVEIISREGERAPIVNGCEFNPTLGVSSVHIDNAAAARDGMNHLYELGHRCIGVITGRLESPISRDRLEGCRAAALAHNKLEDLIVVNGDFAVDSGALQTRVLLAGPIRPTAIFCFSDDMAIGALHALREAGLTCPKDVSVLGFDDIHNASFAYPPLTTIRQPMAEIGRRATELLVEILDGRSDGLKSITLDHALIVRGSTGPARVCR